MTRLGQYLTPGANVTACRERGWGNLGGGVAPPPLSHILPDTTTPDCPPWASEESPKQRERREMKHILRHHRFEGRYNPY
jgi:hypothetical protein